MKIIRMRCRTLEDVSGDRNNNLNLIRFLAAILVIISHAFPISGGSQCADPMQLLTKEQLGLGSLAVSFFFFYGGFLIAGSAERCRTFGRYFRQRILRLFPALIVVVFLSAFLLGPMVTSKALQAYFSDVGTYRYLLNGLLLPVHNLPGVFENNAYNATVNGSLWTLPVEFLCYCLCFAAMKLGILDRKNMRFTVPLAAVGYIAADYILSELLHSELLASALRPMGLFYIGMLYYVYRAAIPMHAGLFWAAVGAFVLSAAAGILPYTIFVFFPYSAAYLAWGTGRKASSFGAKAEISFGIYLCAWPIQQVFCQLFGGAMNPLANIALSIPAACLCGLLLCLWVEKPVSRLARKEKQRK